MAEVSFEYGFQYDCFGHCDMTHPQHGEVAVIPALFSDDAPDERLVARYQEAHSGRLVRRVVTRSDWEPVEERVPHEWRS